MQAREKEFREPVRQEDTMGCAVASIAFVLGVSYQEALKLYRDGERRVKEQADFYCPEITRILNSQGLNYSWVKLDEDNKYIINFDFSIVFIESSIQYPYGHFFVRYNKTWMDPWINLPNTNFIAGYREELPGKPTYAVFRK